MKEYRFVKMLEELDREDILLAGGKGANLGEMIKTGLPVPGGFVLLADAYRRFVDTNDLTKEIDSLINALNFSDIADINSSAERIRNLFISGEIPADIKVELAHIYEELGGADVAVRSSATAEDLPGASFAGQYTTFLNIKGREELNEAVKKCWASLWNERAVSYRVKQNIDSKNLAHGVVVQKMIDAEKSGILFTANPINGRRDQVSLSASWGLGEAIVSGEVDPDLWVINKETGETVSEYIATKKVMTVRRDSDIELVEVDPGRQEEITLSEGERKELLALALKVENHYDFPQDLEWAFENGKFYLVQTRPVTALFPMPQPEDTDGKLHLYANMSLYSIGTDKPFTPLTLDLWNKTYLDIGKRINRKYYREPALWNKTAGGRLFLDITSLVKSDQVMNKLTNEKMFNKDPVTIQILQQLVEREKDQLVKAKTPFYKTLYGLIVKTNPWIIKYIFTSMPKMMYGVLFPQKALSKANTYGDRKIAETAQKRQKLQERKEKLEFIRQISPDRILFNSFEIMFYGIVSLNYADKARKLLVKHGIDVSEVDKVEKAVPNCVTTDMGMKLLQIAKKLDQAGEELSSEHPEIIRFLDEYGHRANEELDVGLPRWKEEPGYVVSLIQSYIDNKTYREGIEKFNRDMEEAEQAIDNIAAQLREKGAHRDARKVEKWLKGHRKLYGIRELPKFIMLEAVNLFRELLMEIGTELQAEGKLDQKEDIFMVTFKDIESGENLQEKVRQNREEFQREKQRVSVPRLMTSTGETFYSAIEDQRDGAYMGTPVSPGSCEGVVKVLRDPREASKLNQGDIMVTVATNPGWTPLFMVIGGLILETGGPISHGSVVAREYGIPAVVGVKDATNRFEDGQMVKINGETGSVKILDA